MVKGVGGLAIGGDLGAQVVRPKAKQGQDPGPNPTPLKQDTSSLLYEQKEL